jgi:hypothetical protein
LDGWTEDISGCREFDDLPKTAQVYLNRIEEIAMPGSPALASAFAGAMHRHQRLALALVA